MKSKKTTFILNGSVDYPGLKVDTARVSYQEALTHFNEQLARLDAGQAVAFYNPHVETIRSLLRTAAENEVSQ